MSEPPVLDPNAVHKTAEAISLAVKAHLEIAPPGTKNVYEVLNALGSVAAYIIAGTCDAPSIRHLKFFLNKVVDDEIEGLDLERQGRLNG